MSGKYGCFCVGTAYTCTMCAERKRVSESAKLPGSNARHYVQERPDKCGVIITPYPEGNYERFEARQLLDELTSIVEGWG